MTQETYKILTNKELIKVNQDPFSKSIERIMKSSYLEYEIWIGPLSNNYTIMLVLNTAEHTQNIIVNINQLGFNSSFTYSMKNLWTNKEWIYENSTGIIVNEIDRHSTLVLKIGKVSS
jgi:alpha-galactosidase